MKQHRSLAEVALVVFEHVTAYAVAIYFIYWVVTTFGEWLE